MFTGPGVAAVISVVVANGAAANVPIGELAGNDTSLITVVETAAPRFATSAVIPFISLFAVADSVLIDVTMASRLHCGLSKPLVLLPICAQEHPVRQTPWAAVPFTSTIALGLATFVALGPKKPIALPLGESTSLLLLAVFAAVHVVMTVLQRHRVNHKHLPTSAVLPVMDDVIDV